MQTFKEMDLGRIVGGNWQLICGRWLTTGTNGLPLESETFGQWLTRKKDGLYLSNPEDGDTIWVHPGDDGRVLPFPFTLEQFKSFCDYHKTFEWETITSVFTNDDDTVDADALAALDRRSAGAGVLVRYILGIADTEYLQAWEQHCAIDEVQANIREITALKAVSVSEIQYRHGRLKELSDELTKLKQPAPEQSLTSPAPVVADGIGTKEAGTVEDGLLTKEIAVTFDGVNGWSADRWPKNLSASKWLHPARIALGGAGGASSTWNPLTLAQLMHSRAKGEKPREQVMKAINSRFTLNPVLKPWREAFNEYFATHCTTD